MQHSAAYTASLEIEAELMFKAKDPLSEDSGNGQNS